MKDSQYFIRKPLFTAYVQSLKPKFDAKITDGLPQFTFADVEGNKYVTRCALEYFEKLNEVFGYFIDTNQSIVCRDRWIVVFTDEKPKQEAVVATPLIQLESVVETSSEAPQEAPESTIESTEYLSYDLIDWPRVEAFKNTKGDKAELATYASKYGVTLLKTKTITNMIEDFKSAVGA